jgi:hypothetical protein
MKFFSNTFYDVVEKNINLNHPKQATYNAKKIKKICDTIESDIKIEYVYGKILKYIIKMENNEIKNRNIKEIKEKKEKKKEKKEKKKEKEGENKPLLSEEKVKTLLLSDNSVSEKKNIIRCDNDNDNCSLNKDYLFEVIDNIIDLLKQLSLSIDFEKQIETRKKSQRNILIAIAFAAALGAASGGIGAVGAGATVVFTMVIGSIVTSLAVRGADVVATKNLIEKNTRFIRNKYLLERFGIHTLVSISENLHKLLINYDKEILNFAQKYNENNKDKLQTKLFSKLNDLIEKIDKDIKDKSGFSKRFINKNKTDIIRKNMEYINKHLLTHQKIENHEKKIITILNDYNNYIKGYRVTKKIEEEIIDSIYIYNNYIEKKEENKGKKGKGGEEENKGKEDKEEVEEEVKEEVKEDKKENKEENEISDDELDNLKSLILYLVHKYMYETSLPTSPQIDDKIDYLNKLEGEKLKNLLDSLFRIFENKVNFKDLKLKSEKNNIKYMCEKIVTNTELNIKKTQSRYIEFIKTIVKLFENLKKYVTKKFEDKNTDKVNINDICVDEKSKNKEIILEESNKESKDDESNKESKDEESNKESKDKIKITDIKKIKVFLKSLENVFESLDNNAETTI